MSVLLYLMTFLVGMIAGVFFAKQRNPDHRVSELETLLQDLQSRHEHYQHRVSDHFEQTAALVNELTQRYRDVHAHLVEGAQQLCDDPKRLRSDNPALAFGSLGQPPVPAEAPVYRPSHPVEAHELYPFEPPRDYATKSPDDKGTLDERFGFK